MKTKSIIVILLPLILASCRKDFIVEDIKNKTISIIAPADNYTTTSNQVTFWWEALDGAEKYNIQVVSPSFSAVSKIILDTNITTVKYNLVLAPGNYQWRIRAVNAGGTSAYQMYRLKVDTTSNLSSQVVFPIFPFNDFITNNSVVTFSWYPLSSADFYRVEINNGSVLSATVANTNYSFSLPAISNTNTAFTWRVKAFNDFSVTQYSTAINFTVDLLSPVAPTLISPAHGTIVKDTIKLSWNRSGAPDAKSDSVFVATDSMFLNVISKTRTYQQSIRINLLSTPPNVNNTTYWWRLRSVDSVGNRSIYSSQLKFKLSTP